MQEAVQGAQALQLLYGGTSSGRFLLYFLRHPLFSRLYGWWHDRSWSCRQISSFIQDYGLDPGEFEKGIQEFSSYNEFFTRKLQPSARPLVEGDSKAIIPADGRYLVIPNLKEAEGFYVKGQKFSLESFLQDRKLAEEFSDGSIVIARLNPSDCHRFYFPFACTAGGVWELPGHLYSVNPFALKRRLKVFWENKRTFCLLETEGFGRVLYSEVGATCVGSIHQTYQAGRSQEKGDEKGYFSIGGSSLILLFEKGKISFDEDLQQASAKGLETRCLIGQSLGHRV